MGQPLPGNDGGSRKNWPPAEAEFAAQVSIPEHELLSCIGRGSYGQVWLGRNAMGAYRAVKIVFRESFDSERPFLRELSGIRKFEPVSRLHEGFIDVLQVGINEERGYFYYIMEAGDDEVSGQEIDPSAYTPNTLASEISRRGRLSLQECLQVGMALTHALAELHKHGLVHRDIKPSNVIFVDGVPKLADIGLVAGVLDTRSYVGTEGFIPPEGPGSPQADLFSLGKVLYEASTGKDRHDFPEIPTEWSQSPEYDGLLELNEVILQACKANPHDRYPSAWDMHSELVVVVNGKSVKRLRQLERRLAQMKRAAGIVALVVAVASFIFYQVYREWRMKEEEHQRQVNANVSFGNRARDEGDFLGALPYFAQALRLNQGNHTSEMNDRLRFGSTLAQCPKLVQMWFEPMQVSDAEFSPGGKTALLAQYYGRAEIHDIRTGQLYSHQFGSELGLRSAVYSPDGRFILTTSESSTAIVWDAVSLTQVFSLPHTDKVYTGRFSPDGNRIVTACNDGVARIWNAKTGQLIRSLPRHSGIMAFAGFSHNGLLIVTTSRDGTARVWRADNGLPVTGPLGHPNWVNCAGFSPDDQCVATACEDRKVRVWDIATGHQVMPAMLHNDAVETVEFSPDGQLILTGCLDGTARLWRAYDHQPNTPNSVVQRGERVTHASFSSDGRQIITACVDGSVRVWDLAGTTMPPVGKRCVFCRDACRYLSVTNDSVEVCEAADGKLVSPAFKPPPALEHAQLSANGSFILTCSLQAKSGQTNHLFQAWNADTSLPVGPAVSVSVSFNATALSDDGQRIAICYSNVAQIWNARTGMAVSPPMLHQGEVTTAILSPSAAVLITISGANVYVWNVEAGRLVYPSLEFPVTVVYAEFSRDEHFFVTCCADPSLAKRSAQVWDTRTGRAVCDPLRHGDGVLSASFSRNASRVVTASEDFTARVWDLPSGNQVGLPLRHGGQVPAACFSPDGQWVATASVDHTVRIWDPQTSDPITPPLQHLVAFWDIKFLPDGHHLAIADRIGNTFEWSIPIDERPVADIAEVAELLSGGDFISPVSATPRPKEPLSVIWQRLRAKYPQAFAVSRENITRWHEFQVEACESEEQWSAAAFHLEQLLKLRPGDSSIPVHLTLVKSHLETKN